MHDISGAIADQDTSRLPIYAGMRTSHAGGPLSLASGATRLRRSFPRVLWIDDQISPDDPTVRLMELEGTDVDCAQSGVTGLSLALTDTYDGIILDIRLPDLGGMRILERLGAAGVTAPVLMLSGFGDVETAVSALKAGAADFRNKPVLGDELASVMKRLIARSRVRSPAGASQIDDGPTCEPLDERLDARTFHQVVTIMIRPDLALVEFVVLARAFRQRVTGSHFVARHRAHIDGRAPIRRSLERGTTVLHRMEADLAAHGVPSINRIAEVCGADRADISEILLTATGSSFRECRRALRLRPSLAPVAFGDEQFAQIAYRLGYNHASQFDRDFLLTFGLSPGELRRRSV